MPALVRAQHLVDCPVESALVAGPTAAVVVLHLPVCTVQDLKPLLGAHEQHQLDHAVADVAHVHVPLLGRSLPPPNGGILVELQGLPAGQVAHTRRRTATVLAELGQHRVLDPIRELGRHQLEHVHQRSRVPQAKPAVVDRGQRGRVRHEHQRLVQAVLGASPVEREAAHDVGDREVTTARLLRQDVAACER